MELSYNERSIVEQALIEYGFWIDINEDSKDRKIEVNNTIVKVLNKLSADFKPAIETPLSMGNMYIR